MKFTSTQKLIQTQYPNTLILGIYEGNILTSAAQKIDQQTKGQFKKLLKQNFTGALEESIFLPAIPHLENTAILCIGLGQSQQLNVVAYKKAIYSGLRILKNLPNFSPLVFAITDVEIPGIALADVIRILIQETLTSFYSFTTFITQASAKNFPQNALIYHETKLKKEEKHTIAQGMIIGNAMNFTKELANLPSNICTPSYLSEQAKKLAKASKFHLKILDEKGIAKEKMNTLLAVAKGSQEAPRFIELTYRGGTKNQAPYVLVGKGVTFDSGGISIKPSESMDLMKYDMSGAAVALGTIKAISELGLPINVVVLIPTCENLPGGSATKPGDIIKSRAGLTVEILNTDAEGRLILCDALDYAKTLKPKVVIDIATLTGAIRIALGSIASGLMTRDEELAKALVQSGQRSGDRTWRLPLWDDYQASMDSSCADVANISLERGAGSIQAACFLERFTNGLRWAHLDIAAIAYLSGEQKGSTGRPLPLLIDYFLNECHAR